MKKTISITLNETTFQIEEDAYVRLDKYFQSIKEHYKQAEGKEIIFDIESSIAEKFSQKKDRDQKTITLKDVNGVIKVMGTVDEFEEDTKEDFSPRNQPRNKLKRLFRDSDDAIIGGVCSGIAAYFDIDPLLVRILFIVLTILGGSGIIIYLILWAIVPAAKTSAQKLGMKGRPVNLEEIQELAREKSRRLKEEGKNIIENVKRKKGDVYKILKFLIKLLEMSFVFLKKIGRGFFLILSVFVGIVLLISFVASILGLTVSLGVLLFNINSPYIISDLPVAEFSGSIYYYAGIVAAYFVALIPLVFLTMLSITMIRRKNSFNQIFNIALIIIWILAVTGASVAAVDIVPRVNAYIIEANEKEKITREYDFKDFSRIELTGNGLDVKIIQGDEFSVKATGQAEDLNRLLFSLEDEELTIKRGPRDTKGKWCFICWQKEVEATIVVPGLNGLKGSKYVDIEMIGFSNNISLELSGYSELEWKDLDELSEPYQVNIDLSGYSELAVYALKAEQINITQSSYSNLYLSGQADLLNAELSGYSELDGSSFTAKEAMIESTNYSDVVVGVMNNIYAIAKNYSNIEYIGHPEIVEVSEYNYSEISQRD